MSDIQEALKRKFAPLAVVKRQPQPPALPMPTPQPKGKPVRERLVMRIRSSVVSDLRALKLALGTDITEMVEAMVAKGVAEKVAEVSNNNPGEWDVIRRCAAKG